VQRAVRARSGVKLITAEDMIVAAPGQLPAMNPFSLHTKLTDRGVVREAAIIPDIVFGLELADGVRRNFMVEIDRGTMPVRRSDPEQTSIERKMRVYLAAHTAKQHREQFGWVNFRVLFVTTDQHRIGSMIEALRRLRVSRGVGPALFLFNTLDTLRGADPLTCEWIGGNRQTAKLM
jgi:hypothetical protein